MEEKQIIEKYTSLCDGIEYYLKKYNLTFEDITHGNELNPSIHKDILNLIVTNIKTDAEMSELREYYNKNKKQLENSQNAQTTSQLHAQTLVQWYVQYFYKYFYTIENGKLNVKDNSSFIIQTNENVENIEKIINDNRCPLIIMKDGTCYVSPNDHIDLVNWFRISENTDFKDGLRIVMYARNGNFEVSSMQGYAPTKDTFPLHITYDQADKMMLFYRYTCKKSSFVKSIDTILLTSSGLGLGKYDTNPDDSDAYNYEALRNLKVLSNTFDSDEFDVPSYKSMIQPFRENRIM